MSQQKLDWTKNVKMIHGNIYYSAPNDNYFTDDCKCTIEDSGKFSKSQNLDIRWSQFFSVSVSYFDLNHDSNNSRVCCVLQVQLLRQGLTLSLKSVLSKDQPSPSAAPANIQFQLRKLTAL